MSDSTTPGYIQETAEISLNDDQLADLFQQLVVGLTGLDPTLVRPRWQPQPPTQPSPDTDWCAIGITTYTGFDYPQVVHDNTGDGSDTLYRLERIDVIATFYGPQSANVAGKFRDGLYLHQNHVTLSSSGVKLRSADEITHVPELINSQFIPRSDIPMSFVRLVQRSYPVLSIGSAGVAAVVNVFVEGDHCTEIIENP